MSEKLRVVGGSAIPSVGYGKTSDDSYQAARLDKATHSIQTIDYAHHEVHDGRHFMYTDHVELEWYERISKEA